MTGKRVQFDPETWALIDLLAKDRTMTFQELAAGNSSKKPIKKRL